MKTSAEASTINKEVNPLLWLSKPILREKGHDWANLMLQTRAYAHQIPFTWLIPGKIQVGARLNRTDSCYPDMYDGNRFTQYYR